MVQEDYKRIYEENKSLDTQKYDVPTMSPYMLNRSVTNGIWEHYIEDLRLEGVDFKDDIFYLSIEL